MLIKATVLLVSLFMSSLSFAGGDFPTSPDPQLTPGSLCRSADQIRYPEKIKYCKRDVSSGQKRGIYQRYDNMGFHTLRIKRADNFKIDHYIPLCAGGSNESSNLWPQHESVFRITDKLEELICIKMSNGRLKQKDAVEIIIHAKNNLELVPEIIADVEAL